VKLAIPCKITHSSEDDTWYVEAAPGIYSGFMTNGDTLEFAKKMASEALTGLLLSFFDHGTEIEIPEMPSEPDWYLIEPQENVAFAFWLRSRRKASGMTLTEVADKLGVKYQVYQKLENPDTTNPTLRTLKKLEKIFGETLVMV
jgi:antitoxin HicB